jgi:predicted MFS family arabinose efflux permease
VGGSTLLADQLSPAERARTQGANDLLVGLASALASALSGFIFAATSYTVIALVCAALSLVPIVLTFTWMKTKSPATTQAMG